MKKLLYFLLLSGAVCLLFGGCRDYHGLDELTIVAGMAVDQSEEDPEMISVTFEVIDLQSTTDNNVPETKLMESTGRSVAEAVYKANAKLYNNMYFGNCEVLIVSHQVAEKQGLHVVIDAMLRDNETRDNLHVLISGEEDARSIITPPEDSSMIVSFNININVDTEEHPANSTRALELYQVYNHLALDTHNLLLPVIRHSKEEEGLQLDGMAIFTGDHLTGYLPEEEMPYYLLGISKIKGGGYYTPVDGDGTYATVSNRKSTPKHRVSFDGERFLFTIDVSMTAAVTEFSENWDSVGYATVRQLEQVAASQMEEMIQDLADRYRQQGYDIFELGDCVRNYLPRQWEQVQDDWPRWLADAQVAVRCTVKIDNTGLIEKY